MCPDFFFYRGHWRSVLSSLFGTYHGVSVALYHGSEGVVLNPLKNLNWSYLRIPTFVSCTSTLAWLSRRLMIRSLFFQVSAGSGCLIACTFLGTWGWIVCGFLKCVYAMSFFYLRCLCSCACFNLWSFNMTGGGLSHFLSVNVTRTDLPFALHLFSQSWIADRFDSMILKVRWCGFGVFLCRYDRLYKFAKCRCISSCMHKELIKKHFLNFLLQS